MKDVRLVERAIELLARCGIRAWVFGGWAEELLGLAPTRAYGDIDLLVTADDWSAVDALLTQLDEIPAKRFGHKRAFVLDGVMVELFLVRRDDDSLFTTFWGERRDWPAGTLDDDRPLPVASAASVAGYRAAHPSRPALTGL